MNNFPIDGSRLDVHDEDKVIVQNVLAVVQCLKAEKILKSWNVDHVAGIYILEAYIKDDVDFEYSKPELDTVYDVNPLRVLSVSLARVADKMRLKVRISDHNEPIMLTETQVIAVRKRARWGM